MAQTPPLIDNPTADPPFTQMHPYVRRPRRFPPICRFYNRPGGCRAGESCQFRHILRASGRPSPVPAPEESLANDISSSEGEGDYVEDLVEGDYVMLDDFEMELGAESIEGFDREEIRELEGGIRTLEVANQIRQIDQSACASEALVPNSTTTNSEQQQSKSTPRQDPESPRDLRGERQATPSSGASSEQVKKSERRNGHKQQRLPIARPQARKIQEASKNAQDKDKQTKVSRQVELEQVELRFRSSYKTVKSDDQGAVIELDLPPSDPEFPYELESIQLRISLPADYPTTACSVEVLNEDIPKGFARNVERGFEEHVRKDRQKGIHFSLLQNLNWLDHNLESLLRQPPSSTIRFVKHSPIPSPTPPTTTTPSSSISPPPPTNHADKSNHPQPLNTTSSAGTSPSVASPQTAYTPEELASARSRREQEVRQLQTRFRQTCKVSGSTVSLQITPSDSKLLERDDLGAALLLQIHVPETYPLVPCTISIQNEKLPSWKKENISEAFLKRVQEQPTFSIFQHLNWLDRSLGSLMVLPPPVKTPAQPKAVPTPSPVNASVQTVTGNKANKKIDEETRRILERQELTDESSRYHFYSSDNAPERETHEDEFASSSQSEHDSQSNNEVSDDFGSEDEEEEGNATDQRPSTDGAEPQQKKGTELRLTNIMMQNIALLQCTLLNLVVRCARCKSTNEVSGITPDKASPAVGNVASRKAPSAQASEKSGRWTTCSTCTSLIGVKYLSDFIHQNSISLGLLQLAGCTPFDLLPSTYVPTCSNCNTTSNSAPFKNPSRGQASTITCRECHEKMTLTVDEIRFVRQGSERLMLGEEGEQLLKLKAKKKTKQELGIVMGQPLPNKGTCKHYKKSYRWLRFGGCCNKVYPCDICHDEAEDHTNEFANRMICGFCSREQPYSQKPCASCGNEFARAGTRGFWEGGSGTRDKARMSRNDPRKHKGEFKTTSKKATRVGPVAKKKT
ncbi:uncharacterized protein VTP21DRAFT_11627 [Calcarisporiella thermophila]|uniref:uncharacterized protein n=1 Tax=Calcarisporiella thermophila TaxID=911321 RepID=UPI0037427045